MTTKYRMIQVGTGGQGNAWCARFLPANIADGRIEVVAAVDINPEVHINAQQHLGLPPEKCYTDIERAFEENRADFCSVVVPPAFHEAVVDIALAHDLHIISEKPIADTLSGSVRIADKVKRAGKKMGCDDEPPIRPGQDDAAQGVAFGPTRRDRLRRVPLYLRSAQLRRLGRAFSAYNGRGIDDRRIGASPRHHR